MCAMVPCTPSVLTLPVTVPSSATRKLPLPEPPLVTGGTSSAPVSLTLVAPLPGIQSGIFSRTSAHAASASTAAANTAVVKVLVMMSPLSFWLVRTLRRLEYSHAQDHRFNCAFAFSRSRPFARASGADLREAARRLRRRRDQDRIAAGGRPERSHGRAARRSGHAEPAPQQALDDPQSQASGGARRLCAA